MDLVDYSKMFMGIPYKWGGQHPAEGYDCSGFIQEVLASRGLDPRGDQTAHDLFNRFVDEEGYISPKNIGRNDLLFFGKGTKVTHIALAIDENFMIEAGGGNSKTSDTKTAIAQQAMIRVRPIKMRSDLFTVLRIPKQLVMDL